jgi:hypothetical protein
MSVKGFLEKYFKPEATQSAKVNPAVTILEPMVGTLSRNQLDFYKTVQVKPQQQEPQDRCSKTPEPFILVITEPVIIQEL